nr:MAG TPA: hypothetical protein [Caudoviricetes sp.]
MRPDQSLQLLNTQTAKDLINLSYHFLCGNSISERRFYGRFKSYRK